LETKPFNWNVRRREVDFIKLREYYLKRYPQFVIPPLIIAEKSGSIDGPSF